VFRRQPHTGSGITPAPGSTANFWTLLGSKGEFIFSSFGSAVRKAAGQSRIGY
jgi:hypothetical protein